VLIDAGEGYAVLAAMRGLKQGGFRPWILATHRATYARFSRAAEGRVDVIDPLDDPQAFVAGVAQVADLVDAALVLPGSRRAAAALSDGRADFPASTRLGVPAPSIVARAANGAALAELAPQAGLEALPADGFASATLEGKRMAVSGVARDGQVLCVIHERVVRTYPSEAELVAVAETIAPEEAVEWRVRRLIELLEWTGIFHVRLLRAGGRVFLAGVEPTVYPSLALAVAAGMNLPALLARAMLDGDVRPSSYRVGVRYRAEEQELRTLTYALSHGQVGTAIDVLRPRRGVAHAAFALRDPLPILSTVRQMMRPRHR
jgi:hypothetical protein